MKLSMKLTEAITQALPANIKPLNYVMEKLDIGRESAYRRLRGEIAYTMDEMAILCANLGISIDQLLMENQKGNMFFKMDLDITTSPEKKYEQMLENNVTLFTDFLSKAPHFSTIFAINKFPFQYLPMKNLFKFEYFKYIYSYDEQISFADLKIPAGVQKLQHAANSMREKIPYLTILMDASILKNTIIEILYFYHCGNLSLQDVKLLKEDLITFRDFTFNLMKTGKNPQTNTDVDLYISILPISNNCLLHNMGDQKISQIWVYDEALISIINNPFFATLHSKWIYDIQKYSTLVSCSNSMFQNQIILSINKAIEVFDLENLKNVDLMNMVFS